MRVRQMEDRIVAAAYDIRSGQKRLVLELGAFDAANAAARLGFDSTATWLAWRCEMASGTAREYVRIARALRRLPEVRAKLESGEVGFSRARAITRAATPATQRRWLELAHSHSAKELEEIVRDERAAAIRIDPTLQAEQRSLRTRVAEDGMQEIVARLPAVEGAIVRKALLAAQRSAGVSDETDEELSGSPLPDRKRADALVTLARAYLSGEANPAAKGEQYAVLVHLSALTGEARLPDGPSLPPELLQPILREAKVALTDGKRAMRAPKSVTKALRALVLLRDQRCQWPGCRNHVWLDAHHVVHRGKRGSNDQSNLSASCEFHHRAGHALGAVLEQDALGRMQVRLPDGTVIASVPPPLEGGPSQDVAS